MTFEFTSEQQSRLDRARTISQAAADAAQAIDTEAVIPDALRRAVAAASLADPFADGEIVAAAIVEELSAASAGLGAAVGFASAVGATAAEAAGTPALPGLRGGGAHVAAARQSSARALDRAHLAACAVALGVGRAAVEHGIGSMKAAGIRPAADERLPHWAVADAATEVDAARLLTQRAAALLARGDAGAGRALALARALALGAAERAVAAAIRVEGEAGYARGTTLERLTRDARTLSVVFA